MTDRIDLEQVREIIRLAEEAELAELDVESPSLKVRVRRAVPVRSSSAAETGAHTAGALGADGDGRAAGTATEHLDHLEPLISPMVGTFYRGSSPDTPPFVSEGDVVDEGQVVCIIEAMKLFNEIQAEKRGRVVRALVENATPVEFGQPLFLLDTSAARG